jgi:hypothetical protein
MKPLLLSLILLILTFSTAILSNSNLRAQSNTNHNPSPSIEQKIYKEAAKIYFGDSASDWDLKTVLSVHETYRGRRNSDSAEASNGECSGECENHSVKYFTVPESTYMSVRSFTWDSNAETLKNEDENSLEQSVHYSGENTQVDFKIQVENKKTHQLMNMTIDWDSNSDGEDTVYSVYGDVSPSTMDTSMQNVVQKALARADRSAERSHSRSYEIQKIEHAKYRKVNNESYSVEIDAKALDKANGEVRDMKIDYHSGEDTRLSVDIHWEISHRKEERSESIAHREDLIKHSIENSDSTDDFEFETVYSVIEEMRTNVTYTILDAKIKYYGSDGGEHTGEESYTDLILSSHY